MFIHDNDRISVESNQTADSLPPRLGGRWVENETSFSLAPISVL